MATESSELPEPNPQQPYKPVQKPDEESTDLVEAVQAAKENPIILATGFSSDQHPDATVSGDDLNNTTYYGDPEKYHQFNNPAKTNNEDVSRFGEKLATAEEVKDSYILEQTTPADNRQN